MRRTTVTRTPVGATRDRRRRDEVDECRERPEIRADIRRTWWPQAPGDDPAGDARRR
jgi:hypothetical protein